MWKRVVAVALLVAACEGEPQPAPAPETAATTALTAPTSPFSPARTSSTRPAGTNPPQPAETASPPRPTRSTISPLQGLAYREVGAVEFPTFLVARPGDAEALLAERRGVIRRLTGDEVGDVVLDLSSRTTVDGERGLLGLARHPDDDRRLFVHYTDEAGSTVVSEFGLTDGLVVDPGSERVLVTVDQPAANHNGGMIQFGPDGALYVGLGDGGGAGDRFANAQNLDTLLGGLVRVDVDSGEAVLWQHGLRNPWRFWIEGEAIWIGDVGQRGYEEVDLGDVTVRGINYGWPIMEGSHCYESRDCDGSGLHLPLVEVPRGDGGACSITGGTVYGGSDIPELAGRFLFSDYCGGFLRSVDMDGNVQDHTDQVGVPGRVVSFGVDGGGEIYVLTVDRVLRLVAQR